MKKWVRLNALQTFITCTPTFWSGKVSTPKKKWSEQLEWAVVHSKWSGISCTPIFLEWTLSALQIFWSGLEVHPKTFGVDFGCTPNFGVNFECMIVYSKVVKILEW
jgi:hypothetical protein